MNFSAFAGFDAAVATAVRSAASPVMTRVMWVATLTGDTAVMVVLTAVAVVLLWAWGRRRSAVVLVALMMIDPLLAQLLKAIFGRARPSVAEMLVGLPSGLSFPSGHALATGLFWGLLALFALRGSSSRGQKALAVAGALIALLLVGGSRVYLGLHYPSDVIGSWLLAAVLVGAGWGALVLWDRIAGPEASPSASQARTTHMRWLLAASAIAAVVALVLQARADPLIK